MYLNRHLSAALIIALISTPGFAQQNQTAPAQQPASTMTDGSQQESPVPSLPELQGYPSLESGTAQVSTQEIFQRLDTDGDGSLTEAELSVYGSPAAGKDDSAKDPATAQQLMETYDTNQDGQVKFREVEDVHEIFDRQRTRR